MWQIIVTFAAVVLILYLSYVVSKALGKGMAKSSNSRYMRMVDQITIGQDRHMAIVQAGTKYLLIGITSGQITILAEIKEEELLELTPQNDTNEMTTPDFKSMLTKLTEAGKKRR